MAQTLTVQSFFDAMNLNYPGLEYVKTCVDKGDLDKAKKEYVKYLKKRKSPVWHFDWHDFNKPETRNPNADIQNANRFADNELVAHGTWYSFGEKVDWTANHSFDDYDEWLWQLNRHTYWSYMGDAYWATGDEKYAKAYVNQINGWIDQCPVPTRMMNGVGSVWRTLDAGLRMKEHWPNSFFCFLASSSFDDESIVKVVMSFYEHGRYLREYNTSNNWITVEMSGLYTVGVLFPEFKEAEEWRTYAVEKLYEQEKEQFYPDGAQIELAPGYHSLCVSSFLGVLKLARLNNLTLPNDFVKQLEKAFEYYIKIRLPDGTTPGLNDSDWIETKGFMKQAASLFPNREDFKYFATDGKEGVPPSYTSTWMPWAGWYVMRSGWDPEAFYSIFEVGPYGSAHQHEDKLSFILYAYGNRLITECGKYSYDRSDWAKYSASARGHNVTRVDGKDQNREAIKRQDDIKMSRDPLRNVWKNNRKFVYGEGQYAEGYGENLDKTVRHNRSIKFVKDKYWIVEDTFIPSDSNVHSYDTWFHFTTPEYGIDEKTGVVYSYASNSANIAIIYLGEGTLNVITGQKTADIQGWRSVIGGGNGYHCEPVATPVYHVEGKEVVKESYVFIPYKANEKMPVKRVRKRTNNKYIITLLNGEKYKVVLS